MAEFRFPFLTHLKKQMLDSRLPPPLNCNNVNSLKKSKITLAVTIYLNFVYNQDLSDSPPIAILRKKI